MSHASEINPTSQGYPLPWTMSPGERIPEASQSEGLFRGNDATEPAKAVNRWLREFLDERTGGVNPPPMN